MEAMQTLRGLWQPSRPGGHFLQSVAGVPPWHTPFYYPNVSEWVSMYVRPSSIWQYQNCRIYPEWTHLHSRHLHVFRSADFVGRRMCKAVKDGKWDVGKQTTTLPEQLILTTVCSQATYWAMTCPWGPRTDDILLQSKCYWLGLGG